MNQNIQISRNVQQLVKSLLAPNEEKFIYDKCLENVQIILQRTREAEPQFKVVQNMIFFVARFKEEQLPEVGLTVKILANVVCNELKSKENLPWELLDFMLSVNFCAFREAQRHYEERVHAGKRIVRELALAYQKQENEQNAETDGKSNKSETNSAKSSSSGESVKKTKKTNYVLKVATRKIVREQPKPFWLHQYLGPELSTYRFAVCYGKYLQDQLQSALLPDTEYSLLRELLLMFFLPADYNYFKLIRNFIHLKPNSAGAFPVERSLLENFVQPLQNMHLLQVYMDCYTRGIEFETWQALTSALRHLLKPLLESLTHFEHKLVRTNQGSVSDLWLATKQHLPQLRLLCQLTAEQCGKLALPLNTPTHVRAFQLLKGLLQQAAPTQASCLQLQTRKGYAAALLLHMLQVHCKYLDNWWQVGEFLDLNKEFAAEQVATKTGSKFIMRPFDYELRHCKLLKIFKQHIKQAGRAIALLHDSQSLTEFHLLHKRLLSKSLFTTVINCLKLLLLPYKEKCLESNQAATAPDIYEQMHATKDEQMACYYYVCYKETESNFSLDLLKLLLSCAVYAPLDKLICCALQQQLEQRATLVRVYVLHLLRRQLKLIQKLAHLRSVFLILNFKLFGKLFEQFWQLLQQGDHTAAAAHLQGIINTHNLGLTDKFEVHLPSCELQQLMLNYSCERALSTFITKPQLQLYNEAFRRLLPLHLMLRKLRLLPHLPWLAESMQQLREDLLLQLDAQLHWPLLQQAADRCDASLLHADSLPQLQEAHAEFVQVVSGSVLAKSGCHNSRLDAQDLYHISCTFIVLWQRLLHLWQVERDVEQSRQHFRQIEIETQEAEQHLDKQYKLELKIYLVHVDGFFQAVKFMMKP